MVITKPITKLMKIIMNRFLDLVIIVPVLSPIGVMESSTPTLKKSMPTISRAAPTRNVIKILGGIGAMVKHSKSTIPSIGSTAFMVSENFSENLLLSRECGNFNLQVTFLILCGKHINIINMHIGIFSYIKIH